MNKSVFLQWMFIIVAVFSCSSCATIFLGSKADVTFDGQVGEPVTIVTGTDTFPDRLLPATLPVPRKQLKDTIRFQSEHFLYAPIVPGRRTSAWLWGDLYISGPLGLVVDYGTGSIYTPAEKVYQLHYVPKSEGTAPLAVRNYSLPTSRLARPQRLYRHEIGLSCGLFNKENKELSKAEKQLDELVREPAASWMELLADLVRTTFVPNDAFQCGLPGGVSLTAFYFYHLNKRLAIGLTGGISGDFRSFTYTTRTMDAESMKCLDGEIRLRNTLVMPTVKWTWQHYTWGNLYSKAALGAKREHTWLNIWCMKGYEQHEDDFRRMDRRRWGMAFQFCPVGMEVGTKGLRFFSDLGFGDCCVWNFGFCVHL